MRKLAVSLSLCLGLLLLLTGCTSWTLSRSFLNGDAMVSYHHTDYKNDDFVSVSIGAPGDYQVSFSAPPNVVLKQTVPLPATFTLAAAKPVTIQQALPWALRITVTRLSDGASESSDFITADTTSQASVTGVRLCSGGPINCSYHY